MPRTLDTSKKMQSSVTSLGQVFHNEYVIASFKEMFPSSNSEEKARPSLDGKEKQTLVLQEAQNIVNYLHGLVLGEEDALLTTELFLCLLRSGRAPLKALMNNTAKEGEDEECTFILCQNTIMYELIINDKRLLIDHQIDLLPTTLVVRLSRARLFSVW